jgi:hypothetical protein
VGFLIAASQASVAAKAASAVELSSIAISVGKQALELSFTGALESAVAVDATHYAVTINNRAVSLISVRHSPGSNQVALGLAAGTLRGGDSVLVSWHALRDSQGLWLSGRTGPLTAH